MLDDGGDDDSCGVAAGSGKVEPVAALEQLETITRIKSFYHCVCCRCTLSFLLLVCDCKFQVHNSEGLGKSHWELENSKVAANHVHGAAEKISTAHGFSPLIFP